ncbi:MAG: sugar phosphate isomerase/epimerase family protein [Gaiellaceae bacterium]
MDFGINLGFAIKRWPRPQEWAAVVRDELRLDLVQFSFDLLDPWWPEHRRLAARTRAVADEHGIRIHSAQVGLAKYTYNGLLHPDPDARAASVEWWRRGIDVAAELGCAAMGGPVGAISVAELAQTGVRERRYAELLDTIASLAEHAKAAGLESLLVEPTPLIREIPSSIDESERLARDLEARCAVPVRYVLDVGHALYQPLYGESSTLADWLRPLARHVGVLHLQNTDFQSDSHWGWPDERGVFDVTGFAADVREVELGEVPVFLELFDAFEADDARVLRQTASSVEHCKRALAAAP